MWVLCCGMPRSASTLQYSILVRIVEELGLGRGLGTFHSPQLLAEWLNTSPVNSPEIAVMKLHEYTPEVEQLLNTGLTKALYIYRDIRDVVVSWMRMQNLPFEAIDPRNLVSSCLANYTRWTELDDVLISRYESVIAQGGLLAEVRRIAAYIGLELEDSLADSIAERFSLERQREYIARFDYGQYGIAAGRTIYDPKTLLHNRHINSGASGEWRTVLTREQQQLIIEWAGGWLQARGYC
jgi:hypothetical protein